MRTSKLVDGNERDRETSLHPWSGDRQPVFGRLFRLRNRFLRNFFIIHSVETGEEYLEGLSILVCRFWGSLVTQVRRSKISSLWLQVSSGKKISYSSFHWTGPEDECHLNPDRKCRGIGNESGEALFVALWVPRKEGERFGTSSTPPLYPRNEEHNKVWVWRVEGVTLW